MISTLYFLQFIAFYLWQITSRYAKREPEVASAWLSKALENKKITRIAAAVLLFITAVAFTSKLGLMSGICGFIIGLMAVGCLSAMLSPFGYLRLPGLVVLYLFSVALEIFI